MTSMPASRSARAMIFAPRSCPSRPGFATTTRIFLVLVPASTGRASLLRDEHLHELLVVLRRAAGAGGDRERPQRHRDRNEHREPPHLEDRRLRVGAED